MQAFSQSTSRPSFASTPSVHRSRVLCAAGGPMPSSSKIESEGPLLTRRGMLALVLVAAGFPMASQRTLAADSIESMLPDIPATPVLPKGKKWEKIFLAFHIYTYLQIQMQISRVNSVSGAYQVRQKCDVQNVSTDPHLPRVRGKRSETCERAHRVHRAGVLRGWGTGGKAQGGSRQGARPGLSEQMA